MIVACIFSCLLLYVDDVLLINKDIEKINESKNLSPAKKILRTEIKKKGLRRKLFLSQRDCTMTILETFGMRDCKVVQTPMEAPLKPAVHHLQLASTR